MAPGTWVTSSRTAPRGLWGVLGVLVFGAAALASIAAFVKQPAVDSGVLVLITLPFLVMAVVLALEGLGQGMVRVDEQGYATPLGTRRSWADVLAVGTGQVDGRDTPVVAVRDASGDFPINQDVFTGFADEDAPRLVAALREHAPATRFGDVEVGQQWWSQVEAEADRATAVVREASGREPVSRERVEHGFPGLPTAIRLDYGTTDAGEGVELVCRLSSDLAVTRDGRRWLRQNRKRSADAATQVTWLFEPHEAKVVPSEGAGFDRLVLTWEGRKPLPFNAEEPDRF